jgi:hypothetical protein
MSTTRVADMTLDELLKIVREDLHNIVHLEVTEVLEQQSGVARPKMRLTLDDFPVDDVGPWPEGLTFRREEMYDDNI